MLLSQYFYPEMISTGHILTELLLELKKDWPDIDVICAQPTYYSQEKVPEEIVLEGIQIQRTRNTQLNKNTLKGKVINSLSFLLHALYLSLKRRDSGPVILVTNPPLLVLLGPVIKILRKRPFLLIIHDLFPDIAIRKGYLKEHSPVAVLWRMANRWVYKNASFIVVLGRDVVREVSESSPPEIAEKIVCIPNWADEELIYPVDRSDNPFIQELKLEGKFIVEYSGNMGITHDMETIIDAAHAAKHDPELHFLLIGGGAKLEKMKERVKAQDLSNVTFLPYQERQVLKYTLGAAHVSLITLEADMEGLSVPSKLYGILASGRPSIAIMSQDSEVALTLKENQCGLVVAPGDSKGLLQKIYWLKEHADERVFMGKLAREAFLKAYTVKNCSRQYAKLLRDMDGKGTVRG